MASGSRQSADRYRPGSLEQKSVVANLLELYSHDFSEFIDLESAPTADSATGTSTCTGQIAHRLPFLIYVEWTNSPALSWCEMSRSDAENGVGTWRSSSSCADFAAGASGAQAAIEMFTRFSRTLEGARHARESRRRAFSGRGRSGLRAGTPFDSDYDR